MVTATAVYRLAYHAGWPALTVAVPPEQGESCGSWQIDAGRQVWTAALDRMGPRTLAACGAALEELGR